MRNPKRCCQQCCQSSCQRPVVVIINQQAPFARRPVEVPGGGGEQPTRFTRTNFTGLINPVTVGDTTTYDLTTMVPLIVPDRPGNAIITATVQGPIAISVTLTTLTRITLLVYITRNGVRTSSVVDETVLSVSQNYESYFLANQTVVPTLPDDLISFGLTVTLLDIPPGTATANIFVNPPTSPLVVGLP